MKQKYRTIGILGGMGPAATADLYNRIINIFQQRFGARYDKDFPEIVIISLPVPDVVESIENENLTLTMLTDAAVRLEKIGCFIIAIPCNTVHAYIGKLRGIVKIPVISIMEEVALYCKEENLLNVGLLSTEFTKNQELYDSELTKYTINLIKLNDKRQKILTRLIMSILNGEINQSNRDILLELINNFKNKKAEAIILGCTELPLLINQESSDIPLIDTIQLLAEACVRESTKVI
ncbi:amino acid racemase [Candidatus Woesearchaeota archaeon]|nr:amino acid racemase [Candidatus Woesearchaeota archaeon]